MRSKRISEQTAHTLFLLLFASIIFLVLYRRFLFGSAVYLYTDIGSDSSASSYPILVMLSRLFKEGDFSFYTLSSGLGADTTATFLQYINPLKAFLLLFDRNTMPVGILIQLYLETVLTAWAAWRYLLLLTEHKTASMAGGLLFAYSSYAVLWSQNLSYGVCVTMFALSMFAIEAFLRKRTLLRFLALTGVLAVYLFTNYFFCYMTAVFVIVYIPLRALFVSPRSHRAKSRLIEMLRQFFLTGFGAACALLLSAAAVVAITGSFLGSVRTSDATRSLPALLKRGFDLRMFAASAARLFSENLLGIGDEYKGPDNYYEIAALSVGALFFFAFFYLLYQKRLRGKLLLITLLSVLALNLPVLRYYLNMNWLVMRFSFWISLLMCIAVSFFLRDLFTSSADSRALLFSVGASAVFSVLVIGLLYAGRNALEFSLSKRTLLFCGGFLVVYAVCFLLLWRKLLPHKVLPALLFVLIAGEIVVLHHDTLYLRLYLTKDQFRNELYPPETDTAVRELQAADPELYRIASTENAFLANEGLVDGFNGTTLYNNTNPAALRSLALAYGTNEVSTPYFLSCYPEYAQLTALAGRYVIRTETIGSPVTEPALFERAASYPLPDGATETVVYRNRNALPFGYVLEGQIPEKDYLDSDLVNRMQLLTRYWYVTGEAEVEEVEEVVEEVAEEK